MNEGIFLKLREQQLPQAARARIMAACRAEVSRPPRIPRRAAGIIIAAALLIAATLTVGAIGSATEWFGLRGKTQSHFMGDPDIVIAQPDAVAAVDPGADTPLTLRCDAVTGGGNQLYLSLTLTRTDGGNIVTVEAGETLLQIDFPDAVITFADGAARKVYLTPLADSKPDCVRMEGSALLYDTDLARLDQAVTLIPGEMTLTVRTADGNCQTRTYGIPTQPMPLSLSYRNATRESAIPPLTLHHDGITITLTQINMTNAELILSGSCDAPNGTEMPWLAAILNEASLTLADGTTIPCGTKNGCGSMPDGSFVLTWLLDKAIDADKVVALTLDGLTLPLT